MKVVALNHSYLCQEERFESKKFLHPASTEIFKIINSNFCTLKQCKKHDLKKFRNNSGFVGKKKARWNKQAIKNDKKTSCRHLNRT